MQKSVKSGTGRGITSEGVGRIETGDDQLEDSGREF